MRPHSGGGSNAWGLISTLHRAGRYRLERYCGETLLQFRGHAEAVSGQRFDLSNPEDYALLLGLAQHHGLPTPMLDWTGSPYIAAFFAFADALENSRKPGEHVRIYGLVRQYLQAASPGMVTLPYVANYVCALSISPRNNPRLYAQQGQFLVTNMGDLESYLRAVEHANGQKILIAADIPVECASTAMADLAYMGLTAATLFPGLDGVCRMLRHEMRYSHRSVPPAGKPADMSPVPQSPVVNEIQTDAAQPLQGDAAATSI